MFDFQAAVEFEFANKVNTNNFAGLMEDFEWARLQTVYQFSSAAEIIMEFRDPSCFGQQSATVQQSAQIFLGH